MNTFQHENHGINTYLVYSLLPGDMLDTMSLGMITNNRIPGLAQTLFSQIDNEKYIKYNISAKVTVSDFFAGVINRKRLLGVFGGIVDAMISADEYMIDGSTIVLDTNYIYTDVSTCETSLICLPLVEQGREAPNLGNFFRNIMFSHQFDQTENCDYIAPIINYLNSTPVFSLYDFKNLLDGLKTASPYGQQMPYGGAMQAQQKPAQAPAQTPVQPPVVQQPVVPQPAPPAAQSHSTPAAFATPEKAQIFREVFGNSTDKTPPPAAPVRSAPRPQPPAQPPVQPPVENGEKISLYKLLSHYNKENAAAYKAQKAAKKAAQQAAKNQSAKQPVPPNPQIPATPAARANQGFAVPGQPAPVAGKTGFAVPGRTAPPAGNAGFAVPGQPAPVGKADPAVPTGNVAAPRDGFKVPGAPATAVPTGQREAPVIPAIPVRMPASQPVNMQMPDNFGETTVLGGGLGGETTVLNAVVQDSLNPHLIRVKNDERIPLNKPLFRLGKERSFVDYFIGDNSAISRSHANIVRQGDNFAIVDANSTNHTYVNGGMILSGTEHPLKHGDKIRLANEDFIFQLY